MSNLAFPDHYINRELSLLEFNWRVLAQAEDTAIPLLERLRFLCITCTNLDEFFEIRVAGVKQRMEIGTPPSGPDQQTPRQIFDAIRQQSLTLVARQYQLLNEVLIPSLAGEKIHFVSRDSWTDEQKEWLQEHFFSEILPVLSPLTLDPSRPFPKILNKSLNFIVRLKGKDAFGRRRHRAIVQAPRSLPRLIQLPAHLQGSGSSDFVFLSSIIHAFVDLLFAGMQVSGCYQFRVTRNSDLYVDDEEVEDLVRALEGELAASRYGAAVRLEIDYQCPDDLSNFLLDHFALAEADLYRVDGPVNLNRMLAVCEMAKTDHLKYPPFTPGFPHTLTPHTDIFQLIAKQDVLLHHPFQSFAPVIDFITAAAKDSSVLAIKQTLYRSGAESPIVDQLVAAARAGKEVTVIVELMARFDEAANISLANRLQEAGAHVVFGLVGYKTHAKMALIVRRESGSLKRYVHLGTGNYHTQTTRVYTDYGLFSSNKKLCEDVHKLFMQLTSLTPIENLARIFAAPFTLHNGVLERIETETAHARAGRPGRIIAKLNAISEPEIIRALYSASCAGVKIDLIVRGVCCLRPGVPGVSENIRVRSIIGRFLEHSRVFYFLNDGDEQFFCASADWLDRNFFRRMEICFPVRKNALRLQIKHDLDSCLRDNCQAWELQPDGSYEHLQAHGEKRFSSQDQLLIELAETA